MGCLSVSSSCLHTHTRDPSLPHTHVDTFHNMPPPKQIDRARAIFTHGSNYADPKRDPNYWKQWQDFEVRGCVCVCGGWVGTKEGRGEESHQCVAVAVVVAAPSLFHVWR